MWTILSRDVLIDHMTEQPIRDMDRPDICCIVHLFKTSLQCWVILQEFNYKFNLCEIVKSLVNNYQQSDTFIIYKYINMDEWKEIGWNGNKMCCRCSAVGRRADHDQRYLVQSDRKQSFCPAVMEDLLWTSWTHLFNSILKPKLVWSIVFILLFVSESEGFLLLSFTKV